MNISFYILLLFAQVKDIHFPLKEPYQNFKIAIIDSTNRWQWQQFDSLQNPKNPKNIFSIYANRQFGDQKHLHEFWDFYLDSTHTKFKNLSDSLLKIFPHKPYRMRYVSEYRSLEKQEHLLKLGRSKLPLSLHNFGFALDVGIYRGRKYLRRGQIYTNMGQKAKELGLYWGGDFKGFPDPGHIQYFSNTANFIKAFPLVGFEFLRIKPIFQSTYDSAIEKGRAEYVQDTKQLLEVLEDKFPEINLISPYAIALPIHQDLRNWISNEGQQAQFVIIYHAKEKWVYIQKGKQGYCWTVQ